MTIEEWEKDFKSYINGLQMLRDDYKGIMEYISDGAALLKEQEPVHIQKREFAHMWFWCCGSCGATITDGDKFCRMCGREVKWE